MAQSTTQRLTAAMVDKLYRMTVFGEGVVVRHNGGEIYATSLWNATAMPNHVFILEYGNKCRTIRRRELSVRKGTLS